MEELVRAPGVGNCCDRANFKFRFFDLFGSMYGFHVRGNEKFQTKVGSLMTLGWLVLMIFACAYYMDKLLDKTEPVMQTSRFRSDIYPSIDLEDENVHFYWLFSNLKAGGAIKWDLWWENFSMYASLWSYNVDGSMSWRKIPIVKCETQDWWSKNINVDLRYRKNTFFCLD